MRPNCLIDEYIKKLLKIILIFTNKTQLFPDLPCNSVLYLKQNYPFHFSIFERFLIKFACQNGKKEKEEGSKALEELKKGSSIDVFGTDSLHFNGCNNQFNFINCVGRSSFQFLVESSASENRDILEDTIRLVKSPGTELAEKITNPVTQSKQRQCVFSYYKKPSLEKEREFMTECLSKIQNKLEKLEKKKVQIEVKLSEEDVENGNTLDKLKYLVELESIAKNQNVLKRNLTCLQNLLNQISIVRHEDDFEHEHGVTGRLV
jgi:hypothetical protein